MYACTCTHTRHVIHAVSIYVINICCKICRSHVHLYNGYAWALAFPLVIVVAFVIDHINFCIFATDQKCWFCFFWIYYFVFHTLGINTLNDWCSLHSETAHTQPLHSVLYFIRFSYGCWKWVCVCVWALYVGLGFCGISRGCGGCEKSNGLSYMYPNITSYLVRWIFEMRRTNVHIFSVEIVVTICAMNVLWFQI